MKPQASILRQVPSLGTVLVFDLDPGVDPRKGLTSIRKEPAAGDVAIVVYVAGTDILAGDPLGGLDISREGIVERDALVVGEARKRRLPCALLLGGGYTSESHKVIADSLASLVGQSVDTEA